MIPANPEYSSLNLAAAVQIFCYELRAAAGGALPVLTPEFAPASNADLEGLLTHAAAALEAIGFLDPTNPKRLLPRLRRMVARARLEHEEVSMLRGMCQMVLDALPSSRAND